jgi:hypothetical protein
MGRPKRVGAGKHITGLRGCVQTTVKLRQIRLRKANHGIAGLKLFKAEHLFKRLESRLHFAALQVDCADFILNVKLADPVVQLERQLARRSGVLERPFVVAGHPRQVATVLQHNLLVEQVSGCPEQTERFGIILPARGIVGERGLHKPEGFPAIGLFHGVAGARQAGGPEEQRERG